MHLVTDLAVIRPASYGLGDNIRGYLLYWEQWTYKMTYQAVDSWQTYKTIERARKAALAKNPSAHIEEMLNLA